MTTTPLEDAKRSLSTAWSQLKSEAPAELQASVSKVDDAITALNLQAHEPSGDASIAKYTSFDEWSRHFSNVRMTVVPFGITTSIAILAWGWDRQEAVLASWFSPHGLPIFPLLALFVWLASMLLMLALTYQTYKWGARMLEQAGKAGLSTPLAPEHAISAATGRLRHLRFVLTKTSAWRDVPLWCAILASIGVLIAWCVQLKHFDGQSKPTDVRIINPAGPPPPAPGASLREPAPRSPPHQEPRTPQAQACASPCSTHT